MKYDKPEVKVLGSAINAVQNQQKEDPINVDSSHLVQTTAAYQADE
jgi:hypothetical protein